MKIKTADYVKLESLVNKVHTETNQKFYQEGKLSPMRYRWDVFHAATDKSREFLNDLYQYLNDDNIDTALKKIIVNS